MSNARTTKEQYCSFCDESECCAKKLNTILKISALRIYNRAQDTYNRYPAVETDYKYLRSIDVYNDVDTGISSSQFYRVVLQLAEDGYLQLSSATEGENKNSYAVTAKGIDGFKCVRNLSYGVPPSHPLV